MRDNILFSLFIGILVYAASVLVSLFLQYPLSQVLYNGLLSLLITGFGVFAVTIFLENFDSLKKTEKKDEIKNEMESSDENRQSREDDSEDEFSPMDPTVLEVEDEDNS